MENEQDIETLENVFHIELPTCDKTFQPWVH